ESSSSAATQTVSCPRRLAGTRRLTACIEAVADGAHGHDRCLTSGARFPQLAPQVADEDVDQVGPRVVLISPNRAQQLFSFQDTTLVAQQIHEQLELRSRESDWRAAIVHLAGE